MNKIYSIAFFSLTLTVVSGQNNGNIGVNFNGFYESECDYSNEQNSFEGEQEYLRFYPDNKVISVGTDCDGNALDLQTWFNTDMDYLSIGKYKITNHKIKFSTISSSGKVKYKGKIDQSGLIELKWKSLINGNKGATEFKFVPLEFEK